LKSLAREKGVGAEEIAPGDIVVSLWVRFTCRYGSKGYGKHPGCPPGMEAAGTDVFATARNIGWRHSTIPCKDLEYGKILHSRINSVDLVLIE
jgi:hypothetical protein